MKQSDKRQELHCYIHEKQEEVQREFQKFRSQYEHSGKTSILLAQSECQGAMAAYQDMLRMYGMHVTYDEEKPMQPVSPEHPTPGQPRRIVGVLPVLHEYCEQKHQEAEQKTFRCQQQYKVSGDNKYLFLQRKYAGEVMAYHNVKQYIDTLEPMSDAPDVLQKNSSENPDITGNRPQRERHHISQAASGLLHILVMDPSTRICKSLEMILTSEGFTVTTASDGMIGLDIATKVSPDLILMDSNIARRNEEQLVFILRREKRLRKIPVILLEGTGRNLDERVSRQLGIMASIQKPFQPDELLQTILMTLSV